MKNYTPTSSEWVHVDYKVVGRASRLLARQKRLVARLQSHRKLDHVARKIGFEKNAPNSTKVAQCTNRVAPYSITVGIKKFVKYTHAGSSFKDIVVRISKMKTDLNSNIRFKRYDLKK